jgi:hypothetical protein
MAELAQISLCRCFHRVLWFLASDNGVDNT